jgi:hypothetical protein
MGLTYDWKLTALKKQHTENLSDVVIGTNWKLTGTDEESGLTGVFNGATPFEVKNVNTSSFTPYAELSEEQVLNWVIDYVSGSNRATNYMPHINQMIWRQIDQIKYSKMEVHETDLPWSPTSGSVTPDPSQIAPAVAE